MSKKLSISSVSSAAKKAYSMKQFHLEDNQGEIWDAYIDVKMNPIYISDMVEDVIKLIAKLTDEQMSESFDFEKNWTVLYLIELLKYYTSVDIKEKETAYETLIAYVKVVSSLASLDLLEKIVNCFDKDAKENTFKMFSDQIAEYSSLIAEQTNKLIEEAKEQDLNEVE